MSVNPPCPLPVFRQLQPHGPVERTAHLNLARTAGSFIPTYTCNRPCYSMLAPSPFPAFHVNRNFKNSGKHLFDRRPLRDDAGSRQAQILPTGFDGNVDRTGLTGSNVSRDQHPGFGSQDVEVPQSLQVIAVVPAGVGELGEEGAQEHRNGRVAATQRVPVEYVRADSWRRGHSGAGKWTGI